MRRDEAVFILGEDVGTYGGAFKVSAGLLEEFGPERVIDTPMMELGIAGLAAASSELRSRQYAQVVGILLLLLGAIGLFDPVRGLVPLGGVDVALHLLTGAVLAYFGFTTEPPRRTA